MFDVDAESRKVGDIFAASIAEGKGLDPRRPIRVSPWHCGTAEERQRQKAAREATMSSLDLVKEMFRTMSNRLAAFDTAAHVGLISFGTKVSTITPVTPLFERFADDVSALSTAGDTALWDAVKAGIEMVLGALPGVSVRRRLLVLSDGADTVSSAKAFALADQCMRSGVVVDAILIGDAARSEGVGPLRALSNASSGLVFSPGSLRTALRQVGPPAFIGCPLLPTQTYPYLYV